MTLGQELQGQVAAVTGAASGIGFASAQARANADDAAARPRVVSTVPRLAQTLCQAWVVSASGQSAGKGQMPAMLPMASATRMVA